MVRRWQQCVYICILAMHFNQGDAMNDDEAKDAVDLLESLLPDETGRSGEGIMVLSLKGQGIVRKILDELAQAKVLREGLKEILVTCEEYDLTYPFEELHQKIMRLAQRALYTVKFIEPA